MSQEPFTDPRPADDLYEGPLATGTVSETSSTYGSTEFDATADPYPPVPPPLEPEPSSQDVAKDEAAQLGKSTAEAGQKVAGTAKDQASQVAGEAKTQAKDLLGQARTEITDQTDAQKQRVAQGLQSLSQELRSMSQSDQQGMASDLARQASEAVGDAATWLQDHDPAALLEDVRSFARRRPAAFLGIALTAGVVAGRLTRGMKDAGADTTNTATTNTATTNTATAGVEPFAPVPAPVAVDYPTGQEGL